jgi:hypothetical protein
MKEIRADLNLQPRSPPIAFEGEESPETLSEPTQESPNFHRESQLDIVRPRRTMSGCPRLCPEFESEPDG